ncbi:MAG: hypothetical protein K2O29_04390 [Ruminococcus sp.]|nr:hypothetical protein [Ruminococcus sp.]MDE6849334.1 hypothetical protein [Ruminococcus sp.]MDE7137682.1 hypothetical protein [Ruminococcus sp.]
MKKSVLLIINIALVAVMVILLVIQSATKTDISEGFDGNSENSSFLDNTGLVKNSDEITELVQETAEKLEMNIFIYVAGDSDSYRSDYETECFADDFFDEIYGENADGVFYYMDLSGRSPAYDYISTSGKAVLIYEKNMEKMFDYINRYLPSSQQTVYAEDIQNTVQAFLSVLKTYSNTQPNPFEYYHDKSSGKYMFMKNGEFIVSEHKPIIFNIVVLAVCLVAGLVTAVIVYFVTKYRYRFKKSQNSNVYIKHEKTIFHRSTDTFLRTYTTKHKIETNNSSGGSRSIGGHSHSGGHGGGGRHR